MNLEILKGYKIETELDLRLCQYLGRLNVPNTSENLLKKKGFLVGGKLIGIRWDKYTKQLVYIDTGEKVNLNTD